jgi:hypothetical protein
MCSNKASGWERRDFFRLPLRLALWLPPLTYYLAQPSETVAAIVQQPTPMPGADTT